MAAVTNDGSAPHRGSQPPGRPRVLLAEDSREMAVELRRLVDVEFEVIDLVRDGSALVERAGALRPDVIVADLAMPGLSGLAAAAAILAARPSTRLVFVTMHYEPALVERALDVGALGYVAKRDAGDELPIAIRHALRGLRYLSLSVRTILRTAPPGTF
jgi:DNA-binding NarL/FixJ family response regulator